MHVCNMIVVHVSYPTGLMFDEIECGGLGGEAAPWVSRSVCGAASPPHGWEGDGRYDFLINLSVGRAKNARDGKDQ